MPYLLKRPSGFLPLLISGAFLVVLLTHLTGGTLVRQADEGTAARLFQILMPVQFAIVAFFAVSWLPKKTKAAAGILVLQCCAALAVLAVVYVNRL
jgi:hypothetical protein